MIALLLAAAFAADATIQAKGNAIGPCDPPSAACEQIDATAVVMTEPTSPPKGDEMTIAVALDLRALRRLRRDDDLVVLLHIPRSVAENSDGRPAPDPYSVPLTAPWTTLGLPIDGGSVLYSDETTATVAYEPARPLAALAEAWTHALEVAGWHVTFTNTDDSMITRTFAQENAMITFAILTAGGVTTVSVTMLR